MGVPPGLSTANLIQYVVYLIKNLETQYEKRVSLQFEKELMTDLFQLFPFQAELS